MHAKQSDAYWREHKPTRTYQRPSYYYIAPLIIDGRPTFMVTYLGQVTVTNDGRYRWTRHKSRSLMPRSWNNNHCQGTVATLEEAKAMVEAGFHSHSVETT